MKRNTFFVLLAAFVVLPLAATIAQTPEHLRPDSVLLSVYNTGNLYRLTPASFAPRTPREELLTDMVWVSQRPEQPEYDTDFARSDRQAWHAQLRCGRQHEPEREQQISDHVNAPLARSWHRTRSRLWKPVTNARRYCSRASELD